MRCKSTRGGTIDEGRRSSIPVERVPLCRWFRSAPTAHSPASS